MIWRHALIVLFYMQLSTFPHLWKRRSVLLASSCFVFLYINWPNPPTLLFIKLDLVIWGLLWLRTNSITFFFLYFCLKIIKNLMCWIKYTDGFGFMNILILIHEHKVFFPSVCVFLNFFHQILVVFIVLSPSCLKLFPSISLFLMVLWME